MKCVVTPSKCLRDNVILFAKFWGALTLFTRKKVTFVFIMTLSYFSKDYLLYFFKVGNEKAYAIEAFSICINILKYVLTDNMY